jgi:hypothetical protein
LLWLLELMLLMLLIHLVDHHLVLEIVIT